MKQVTKKQAPTSTKSGMKVKRYTDMTPKLEAAYGKALRKARAKEVGGAGNLPRWRDASENLGKATDDVLTRRKRNFAEITGGITVQEYADRFKINNGKAKGDLVWLSREGLVGHYQEVRVMKNGVRRRLTVYTPRRKA